jgi:GAF domain-containing protein
VPEAAHKGPRPEIRCWILPNLRSMATLGNEACPIHSRQAIARADLGGELDAVWIRDHGDLRRALASAPSPLRIELREGTRRHWVEVPVRSTDRATRLARLAEAALAVSFLLGVPLFLIWRSSSRAATPLALFYGCVSVVLVTTLVGQHSSGMTRFALLALVLAPAAAIHLSFVFPRERFLARDVRALLAIPYGFSALLVPVGWISLERDPLLWPAFVSLLIALTGSAWAVLVASCGFAMRESRSALERARARLVLYGAVLAPLVPTLWLSRRGPDAGSVTTAYLWSAAVTMPLPIALATSRHNLFDLEWDARHVIARALYLAFAALVVASLLEVTLIAAHVDPTLREPAPLLVLASLCVGATDLLRSRMIGALDALVSPSLQRWRRIREELERALSIQRDRGEIVRLLVESLRAGIAPRSGAVLVVVRGHWRVADSFGEPPGRDAAAVALRVLGDRSLVHLAESSALQEQGAALVATGVEAVVAIESGGTRFGLLLLGSLRRRRPLAGVELDFALALASQAGIALRNARITEELLASERHAAAGRAALGTRRGPHRRADRWPDRGDRALRARSDRGTRSPLRAAASRRDPRRGRAARGAPARGRARGGAGRPVAARLPRPREPRPRDRKPARQRAARERLRRSGLAPREPRGARTSHRGRGRGLRHRPARARAGLRAGLHHARRRGRLGRGPARRARDRRGARRHARALLGSARHARQRARARSEAAVTRVARARRMRRGICGLAVLGFCVGASLAAEPLADATPVPARALLARAFANRYEVDLTSVIELVMRSRSGQERRRTLQAMSKVIDHRVHSIGRLLAPEHLRGMTVLMIEAPDRSHDSFLYLPSLSMVRRVTTAQRGDSFFGTDVTYEDLERQRAQDFELGAALPGERAGERVYLIDARPLRHRSYDRVRFALAISDLAILETEYWKRSAREPYRVIRAQRASMVSGDGHVLPTHLLVESRDRGTTTEVWLRDLRINPEIDARLFSVRTLQAERPLPVRAR